MNGLSIAIEKLWSWSKAKRGEYNFIFGTTSTTIILVEAGCGLRLPQVETAITGG